MYQFLMTQVNSTITGQLIRRDYLDLNEITYKDIVKFGAECINSESNAFSPDTINLINSLSVSDQVTKSDYEMIRLMLLNSGYDLQVTYVQGNEGGPQDNVSYENPVVMIVDTDDRVNSIPVSYIYKSDDSEINWIDFFNNALAVFNLVDNPLAEYNNLANKVNNLTQIQGTVGFIPEGNISDLINQFYLINKVITVINA